jgi:hypothetical protein
MVSHVVSTHLPYVGTVVEADEFDPARVNASHRPQRSILHAGRAIVAARLYDVAFEDPLLSHPDCHPGSGELPEVDPALLNGLVDGIRFFVRASDQCDALAFGRPTEVRLNHHILRLQKIADPMDVATGIQIRRHRACFINGRRLPQPERERGVVGVAESVHGGEFYDSSATSRHACHGTGVTDGHGLQVVPDHGDAGACLFRKMGERSRGVQVDHARFVDDDAIAGRKWMLQRTDEDAAARGVHLTD